MFISSYWKIVFVLSICLRAVKCEENYIEIETKAGRIRGDKTLTILNSKEYYSFKGIPYAKPPIGKLRFMPPQPLVKWNNTYKALQFKNYCVQYIIDTNIVIGNEDCLYLNIHTPGINKNKTFPTMVYISGGGFYKGNDSTLNADALLEKNVIVASIDFRLSIFGFLNLNDDIVSGNMGLKDVALALKWINRNIEQFGGDSNNITVFGHSSGAVIINVLAILPEINNLFQRVIIQSFSAYWFDTVKNLTHVDLSRGFVSRQFKENTYERDRILNNRTELRKYLQNIDYMTLFTESYILNISPLGRRAAPGVYCLVVESKRAINPILTDFPVNILKRNSYNLDIMMGFVNREFVLYSGLYVRHPELLADFDREFQFDFPAENFEFDFNSSDYKLIANDVREFYFGQNKINNETFNEYIDLLSDITIVYGIFKITELNIQRNIGKNYLYRFSVDSKLNYHKRRFDLASEPGAVHADEICYLFLCKDNRLEFYKNLNRTSVEFKSMDLLTDLWTNFAKYGNPTPNSKLPYWKPVIDTNFDSMEITNTGLFPSRNIYSKKIKFWDNLFEKYRHLTLNTISYKYGI